jgi:hypothetical protein
MLGVDAGAIEAATAETKPGRKSAVGAAVLARAASAGRGNFYFGPGGRAKKVATQGSIDRWTRATAKRVT